MTSRPQDTAGAELNKYWRQQQAKIKAAQQKPDKEPRIEAPATEKPAVIHQQAPKPAAQKPKIQNQQGPAECEKCQVRPACKTVLKLWHQHAPRPELARGWCRLIDEHAGQMVCLSGIREVSS